MPYVPELFNVVILFSYILLSPEPVLKKIPKAVLLVVVMALLYSSLYLELASKKIPIPLFPLVDILLLNMLLFEAVDKVIPLALDLNVLIMLL